MPSLASPYQHPWFIFYRSPTEWIQPYNASRLKLYWQCSDFSKCFYHRVQHAPKPPAPPRLQRPSFPVPASKDKCMYSAIDYPANPQQIFGWRMSRLRIQRNMKLSSVQTGRGAKQPKT